MENNMGTRSLTFFYDDEQPLLCLYRHMDGYPEGQGQDLHDFLADYHLVNGYVLTKPSTNQANGMGCLAAQYVAAVKNGVGRYYLYPTDTEDADQEYEYHVYGGLQADGTPRRLSIKVIKPAFDGNNHHFARRRRDDKVLFDGSLTRYRTWLKKTAAAQATA
jgi:hypothetical protein